MLQICNSPVTFFILETWQSTTNVYLLKYDIISKSAVLHSFKQRTAERRTLLSETLLQLFYDVNIVNNNNVLTKKNKHFRAEKTVVFISVEEKNRVR